MGLGIGYNEEKSAHYHLTLNERHSMQSSGQRSSELALNSQVISFDFMKSLSGKETVGSS